MWGQPPTVTPIICDSLSSPTAQVHRPHHGVTPFRRYWLGGLPGPWESVQSVQSPDLQMTSDPGPSLPCPQLLPFCPFSVGPRAGSAPRVAEGLAPPQVNFAEAFVQTSQLPAGSLQSHVCKPTCKTSNTTNKNSLCSAHTHTHTQNP